MDEPTRDELQVAADWYMAAIEVVKESVAACGLAMDAEYADAFGPRFIKALAQRGWTLEPRGE